nr:uncharacterized protein LOC110382412 [Helicoverpa armigera]
MRSPPQCSPNTRTLHETQSEPDLSDVPKVPESCVYDAINTSARPGKRFRGDESFCEVDKFEELKNLLQTWKADQDVMLSKLVAEVSELKKQNLSIQKSNSELEKSLVFINTSYEDMKTRLEVLEGERKLYEERFRKMANNNTNLIVAKLEAKIDSMEQQARQCNIEVCNLPEKNKENLVTIIESIGNVVSFPVSHNDVISIHRVPHAHQQDNKPKNVIVKLKSRILRDNLLSAYRKKKSIKSDQLGISGAAVSVYLNEHLTLSNKALFRKCREAANANGFKYVWLIIPEQHGFVQRRSTTTNLMIFTNHLFENMDQRVQVDAVYTDFQKAFDKVDHLLLLEKIAFNGIRELFSAGGCACLDCSIQTCVKLMPGHEFLSVG